MRLRSALTTLLLGFQVTAATTIGAQSPKRALAGPPVPFEDRGACPFEGCVYREWTANQPVVVLAERRHGAPSAFQLQAKDKVTALTGVVLTVKPGRVQFPKPIDLDAYTDGVIHIEPGETLYLLTSHGEGEFMAWFKRKQYLHLDGVAFSNGVCEVYPERCTGKIIERATTEWWVQVRNRLGKVGWTSETEKFDGKDRYGADR
jgi:hypothetical protein